MACRQHLLTQTVKEEAIMKAGELSVDLSVYKGPNRDRMIELCITELDFKPNC